MTGWRSDDGVYDKYDVVSPEHSRWRQHSRVSNQTQPNPSWERAHIYDELHICFGELKTAANENQPTYSVRRKTRQKVEDLE